MEVDFGPLEAKRPLSYAEIVAIHRSEENVATSTTATTNLLLPHSQQQPHQSNTLPRSKKRGRGGGNFGSGTPRYRTFSGSNQEKVEPVRKGSFSGQRGGGRGGWRGGGGGGGHASEKPQFQGGTSRDNPQFHTFPRSRRRQPPDPERYAPNAVRGGPHVGPSQRRILNRKMQLQKEREQQQQGGEGEGESQPEESENLTFTEVLRSKLSSGAPQQHQHHHHHVQNSQQQEQHQQHQQHPHPATSGTEFHNPAPASTTESAQGHRSYASTLASGLDILLQHKAMLEQRKPAQRTDAASVYKSQPILVFRDPWVDQPPPLIPGLRFRDARPLERRNSKKQKQSHEEIAKIEEVKVVENVVENVVETSTLRRRRSKKKRTAPTLRDECYKSFLPIPN